ncbi:MAG TPA: class I SAM-dependent methyltransferase [Mycobacteriales bacterium]|nr:class I SAM-dependent methyltransferase [Mycobacteriales bacterium]
MLTVDFDQFPIAPGDRVLDLGCGGGRHAFELYRRGADVVALDRDLGELEAVERMFRAMRADGEAPSGAIAQTVQGDVLALPFPDGAFDAIIAAEVLEHIPDDRAAMAEIARVLKPGGRAAVTVPRWWPEKVNWALSREYHDIPGGHVRIYKGDEVTARLTATGLTVRGEHHAHALHSPYWWLNCAFGRESLPSRTWHRLLVWDIIKAPTLTRTAERWLNPLMGKSLVVYADKPGAHRRRSSAAA